MFILLYLQIIWTFVKFRSPNIAEWRGIRSTFFRTKLLLLINDYIVMMELSVRLGICSLAVFGAREPWFLWFLCITAKLCSSLRSKNTKLQNANRGCPQELLLFIIVYRGQFCYFSSIAQCVGPTTLQSCTSVSVVLYNIYIHIYALSMHNGVN